MISNLSKYCFSSEEDSNFFKNGNVSLPDDSILDFASSFSTYNKYFTLTRNQYEFGINEGVFFVETDVVKTGVSEKVISPEILDFEFFGFLTNDKLNFSDETNASLPVLHVNENCKVKVSKLPFKAKKVPFKETTRKVTVNTLPSKVVLCPDCNLFSILGIFVTLTKDLLLAEKVYSKVNTISVDFFKLNDTKLFFYQNLENQMISLPSETFKQASLVKKLSTKRYLNLHEEVMTIFDDIFDIFYGKVISSLTSITNSWLSPSNKEKYFALVQGEHSIFKTFDETPIIVALKFASPFSPKLDITSSEYSDEDDPVSVFFEDENRHIINNAFGSEHDFDCFRDNFYFNEAVIINCLLKVFSVHVSHDLRKHILIMPRSLYELLASNLREANGGPFDLLSLHETFTGDFTPETLENFVSIWDENNSDTFKLMWEASKTI